MKNLPISIQTFSDLIAGNYLYVDKTEFIHRLIATGGRFYFLSRPRRFGKSLMLSTLKEIFSGNKKLFENLWIYDKIEWESYPIIQIDFLGFSYSTKE
ncbi:MAG: AAA family ATPase, partial [bacterium]|nr:AAA family ATPase [bacterium]